MPRYSLTRSQLYELVWAMPMQKLAKAAFKMSDVAAAKYCRSANVPLPPRGYWNKLEAGHKVTRVPLPPRRLGQSQWAGPDAYLTSDLRALISNLDEFHPLTEPIEPMIEEFEKRVNKIKVLKSFKVVHPEVQKVLNIDEKRQKKIDASDPIFRRFLPQPIHITPAHRRRLRIINSILNVCESLGGGGNVQDDHATKFWASPGHGGWSLRLSEPSKDGLLVLTAPGDGKAIPDVRWKDGPSGKIEDIIHEIVVEIGVRRERSLRLEELERIEATKKERAQRQAEIAAAVADRERRAKERAEAEAKAQVELLLSSARALRDANDIRSYVAQAQAQLIGKMPTADIDCWAIWALAIAEHIDPLSSGAAADQIMNVAHKGLGGT